MLSNFQMFSESFLADIGRVIAGWSYLESNFDVLFLSKVVMRRKEPSGLKVLEDPEVQRQMTRRFSDRVKALRKYYAGAKFTKEDQKHVQRILDQLLECRRERAEIAHSQISPTINMGEIYSDEATLITKSWKNDKEFEIKSLTKERLQGMFETMNALTMDMFNLAFDKPAGDLTE